MADDHETAGAEKGAEIGWVGVQLLDLGPARLIFVELLSFFTGCSDQGRFGLNLLASGAFVDFDQDGLAFGDLSVVDKLTR